MARKKAEPEKEPRYFIVNKAGAIHEVDAEHARMRLAQPGYRQATLAEVKELLERGGNQRCDDPICEPWSPEPVVMAGLDELDFSGMVEEV
jgi:hypothetical protein